MPSSTLKVSSVLIDDLMIRHEHVKSKISLELDRPTDESRSGLVIGLHMHFFSFP